MKFGQLIECISSRSLVFFLEGELLMLIQTTDMFLNVFKV